MYLFENQEGKILIHDLRADSKDLADYRRDEMKQIPYKERLCTAQTSVYPFNIPLFRRYMRDYVADKGGSGTIIRVPRFDRNKRYHVITPSENRNDYLLNNYYNGKFGSKEVFGIQEQENVSYYLLTRDYKHKETKWDMSTKKKYAIYTMKGIIRLPESLFLLQLLEQRRFELLEGKDMTKILSLYKDSIMDEIDLSGLVLTDKFGITDNAYQESYQRVMKQVAKDEPILKMVKKR